MGRYAGNPKAIADLVQPHQVHRDTYIDAEIFDLEMKHLFAALGLDARIYQSGNSEDLMSRD